MKIVTVSNLLLVIAYLLAEVIDNQDMIASLNQIGPSVLLLGCLFSAYKLYISERYSMLMPLLWFYLAYGVYFGFAPLIYHFGTPESIFYVDYFYPVNELALLNTNLLNSLGILFVLLGYQFRLPISRSIDHRLKTINQTIALKQVIFVFVVTGLFIKYWFAFPYYMGWSDWTLPGAIQVFTILPRVSIILLFVLISEGSVKLKWLFYALVAEELTFALMTLSKLAVIEVIIAIILGWFIARKPSITKLIAAGVLLAMLYILVLSPFVTYARVFAASVGVGTVSEIGQSISAYATNSDEEDLAGLAGITPGVQGWWTRLAYTNAQAFAMADYNLGRGGATIALALYGFVPRIFYEEKPVMTPGREFTAAITGEHTETATAPGVFAEAYWNGGWGMVGLVGLYIGFFFRAFTLFAQTNLASRRFVYMPVILIGITQAYSICDWFAVTYVGPAANAIMFYVLIRFVVLPVVSNRTKITNEVDKLHMDSSR